MAGFVMERGRIAWREADYSLAAQNTKPNFLLRQRVIAVANALLENIFISSQELSAQLGLTREKLVEVYEAIQREPSLLNLIRSDSSQVETALKIQDMLFRNPANLARILNGEETVPLIVEFHTLGPCGNSCLHCYNIKHGYRYDQKSALQRDDYFALVDDLAAAGTQSLNFSGGLEPLSDKQALPAIGYAIKQGLSVTIFTTGLHLTKRVRPLVIGAERIRVSMYGTNENNYLYFAQCRNPRTFQIILQNIRDTVALKQESSSRVNIGICMIVVKENFRELKAMVELGHELGVDTVVIRAEFGRNIRGFTQDELSEIIDMLRQIKEEQAQGCYGNLCLDIGEGFDVLLERERFYPKTLILEKPRSACYATRLKVGVDPWGHIFPCALITQPGVNQGDLGSFMIGSVRSNPFAGIISAYRAFFVSQPQGFSPSVCQKHDVICNVLEGNINAVLAKISMDLSFGVPLEKQLFFPLQGAI